MFPERLRNLAMLILDDAEQARLKIATAESCTGCLLAALFTEIPGSSSVFERGFVTYSTGRRKRCWACPATRWQIMAPCPNLSPG